MSAKAAGPLCHAAYAPANGCAVSSASNNSGALGRSDLEFYAETIELDREAFTSCLDSGRFREVVEQDLRAAQDAGARGTPTFLINGQQAFPSYQSISATIQEILGS